MYPVGRVAIHQAPAAVRKAKHESNLAKWEKAATAWCAEQHGRTKRAYESNHPKPMMPNARPVNPGLSKSFPDLRVTSLSNRIRCTAGD